MAGGSVAARPTAVLPRVRAAGAAFALPGLARARAWAADARLTFAFIGELLLVAGRLLAPRRATPRALRLSDLLWQLDQSGPRSVPIVSLVSGLVGVILAYMGAVQLQRFGAQIYIADLVTVGA